LVYIKLMKFLSARLGSVVFGFSSGQISSGFSIQEDLVCGVQDCSGNFVLRNENIFTFQLTANIGFWEGRR